MPSEAEGTGLALDSPLGKLLGDIKSPHIPCTLAATQGAGAPGVTVKCFQTAPAEQTTLLKINTDKNIVIK